MTDRPPPFVKICCISSVAEARLAVAAGASALGLVSAMPSGSSTASSRTNSRGCARRGALDAAKLHAFMHAVRGSAVRA